MPAIEVFGLEFLADRWGEHHARSRTSRLLPCMSLPEGMGIEQRRSPSCFAPASSSSDCFRRAAASRRACCRHPKTQWRCCTARRDTRRRHSTMSTGNGTRPIDESEWEGLLPATRSDTRHKCPDSGRTHGSPRRSASSTACSLVSRRRSRCSSIPQASTSPSSSCPRNRRNTRTRQVDGHKRRHSEPSFDHLLRMPSRRMPAPRVTAQS